MEPLQLTGEGEGCGCGGWHAGCARRRTAASCAAIWLPLTVIRFSAPDWPSEDDLQPVRIRAQLAFRDVGGEFLRIGAAAVAGDPCLADLEEAQGAAGAVARSVPVPLGSRIAVRHIKLVEGLAGLAVDKTAQAIKIGFGHAEKRRRVLRLGADHADEARRR